MNRRFLNIAAICFFLLVIIGGVLALGHKAVRQKGYPGIKQYLGLVTKNYTNGLNSSPKVISINMSDDVYAKFKKHRDKYLNEGIMLNIGNNYEEITLTNGDKTYKCLARLKGHMSDHLQEKKWSFRIKDLNKQVFGFSKLTFQHPGTRNYVYEWFFHQLAAQEGITFLSYDFIKLKINNEDWGIYALEEHFTSDLLKRNNRPDGPILRFDPTLYWQGRMNEKYGIHKGADYNDNKSAHLDVYQDGRVFKDSTLKKSYERAIYLIESFRRGEMSTTEVFDAELMAKYLAIIDLVGGYNSLDWSDVKLYYNKKTDKIEPIAYESFGVRKLQKLAGENRYYSDTRKLSSFHTNLFSDETFYNLYLNHVSRICSDNYFDSSYAALKSELAEKEAVLAEQYPLKPFNQGAYKHNIRVVKRIKDLPYALKVYINEYTDSTITLAILNQSGFPIKTKYIEFKNQKIKFREWIAPNNSKGPGDPILIHLEHNWGRDIKPDKIEIKTELPYFIEYKEKVFPVKFSFKSMDKKQKVKAT